MSTQTSGKTNASSQIATLGGLPSNKIDTPIAACLILLYIIGAAGHMTIFQLNRRRGHKFLMSGVMFGYCMSRIVTLILRIAWANRLHNSNLALASSIFTAAGVLLLYVVDLIFAQRIVRATHPRWGWSPAFRWAFRILYILIPLLLAMVITATVQMFETKNPYIDGVDHKLVLTAQPVLLTIAFMPLPLMAVNYLLPRRKDWTVEAFGAGQWTTRVLVLVTGATLLATGSGFRVGVAFQDHYHPRTMANPGWYHSKACFWVFDFAVEIITVYLYLALRVDLRFHIPNGSKGPGDYSRKTTTGLSGEKDIESDGEMTKKASAEDILQQPKARE